jgi:transcriptional regulator with XRE-family HTH domain
MAEIREIYGVFYQNLAAYRKKPSILKERQKGDAMGNPIDAAVGERIRQLRKERRITQTELAECIGLTFQQIQKYEKARNRISASKLVQIADIFDVEVGELFYGTQPSMDTPTDEKTELIDAFLKMTPDVRRQFLGLLTAIADNN